MALQRHFRSEVDLSWEWTEEKLISEFIAQVALHLVRTDANGEALLTNLEAVGETTELFWSETAPVASNLYYVVTAEVSGLEVLWLFEMENTASVDASEAPKSIDIEPTGQFPRCLYQ